MFLIGISQSPVEVIHFNSENRTNEDRITVGVGRK
jgi:hypothetical protein